MFVCFDVGHSVVQHLNVPLDDRDLLRKSVVLADFPCQLLNFVLHHGIGPRVRDQHADQSHNAAEDGGNDGLHRRSPLPPAFLFAHVHMHPAVGSAETGRVDAAAASVAQQLVRIGVHVLHADALHLDVRRLAVAVLAVGRPANGLVVACRAECARDGHGLREVHPDLLQNVNEVRVDEYRVGPVPTIKLPDLEMFRELLVAVFQNGVSLNAQNITFPFKL